MFTYCAVKHLKNPNSCSLTENLIDNSYSSPLVTISNLYSRSTCLVFPGAFLTFRCWWWGVGLAGRGGGWGGGGVVMTSVLTSTVPKTLEFTAL